MNIPLSKADITEREKKAVMEVMDTSRLALGPKLQEFEEKMSEYTGVKYAVAVNSGTSALHLIVRSLGITEGDEVITTPFSFIASANCILFEKAIPVFVDIDPVTLNMDIDLIEEKITKKTKAIVAVDVFGHPVEWGKLEEIAARHNLKLIEDSCEAIGAEYKGKKAGSFGEAGTFAFYPNKQITTGEGGMIVTDSEKIYKLCRSMRSQGRSESGTWLQHERLGYNYRISELSSAVGIVQMERIDEILAKREKVAGTYNKILGEVSEIILPQIQEDIKISWFVYVVRLRDNYSREDRDLILSKLKEKGIECSNYFSPIHLQPFYKESFGYKEGDFPQTEAASERTIALPFYNDLKDKEVDYVCNVLKEAVKALK